jgi:hypothetical protein
MQLTQRCEVLGQTNQRRTELVSATCFNRYVTQTVLARRIRFRALSGAMKRALVSVEPSPRHLRATESVRVWHGLAGSPSRKAQRVDGIEFRRRTNRIR